LDSSRFAAGNAAVEKCKEESVEHHGPYDLKENGDLKLWTIHEEGCSWSERISHQLEHVSANRTQNLLRNAQRTIY
jgi:hypothetical protein